MKVRSLTEKNKTRYFRFVEET